MNPFRSSSLWVSACGLILGAARDPCRELIAAENHRSAGAADADYLRDADCVAGPYIPRRKDRREVPYLPQIKLEVKRDEWE